MSIIIDSRTEGLTQNGVGIPVADLLRRFQTIMLDAKAARWSAQEAIDWMNDGATEIVLRRPASRAVTELLQLEDGTYQRASANTAQVLNVIRNIGVDGRPGRTIRIADIHQIDDIDPMWHQGRAGITKNYMVDERSPTTFYVYPPANGGAIVEMLVSKPPPYVSKNDDTLDMRPEFINAILEWMMYRAHSKDSEYAQGAMAIQHYQAFTDAIGAPTQAAQVNSATGNSK